MLFFKIFLFLQAAQKSVDDLKNAQSAAQVEFTELSQTASSTNSDRGLKSSNKLESQGTEQYGEKRYWDSRYAQAQNSADTLYEWYLSFLELRHYLFQELSKFGMSCPLLVTGCGNSTLCEDLLQCGMNKYSNLLFYVLLLVIGSVTSFLCSLFVLFVIN